MINYNNHLVDNSLEFLASSNNIINVDTNEICFENKRVHHYEIFIEVEQDVFKENIGTASKLYRMLSNSNQTTGYVQNRVWWGSMFSGGVYYVYETDNKIFMHYQLELIDKKNVPSELQIKWRFAKAMRGLKFNIDIGLNSMTINNKLNQVQTYLVEHRFIGQWYKEQHYSR